MQIVFFFFFFFEFSNHPLFTTLLQCIEFVGWLNILSPWYFIEFESPVPYFFLLSSIQTTRAIKLYRLRSRGKLSAYSGNTFADRPHSVLHLVCSHQLISSFFFFFTIRTSIRIPTSDHALTRSAFLLCFVSELVFFLRS